MFMMIGGDGRQYGPVTADQLRQWIQDHRADAGTLVQPEGRTDWVPVGTLVEFQEAIEDYASRQGMAGATSAVPPLVTAEAATPVFRTASGAPPGELRVLDCLGRSWTTLQRNTLMITGSSLVVWGLQTVLAMFGPLGALLALVAAGALYGGLSVVVLKLIRGQPAALGDVFACFGPLFLPCLLVWVFTNLLTQLGLALFLLPGIFCAVIWAFSLPLVVDRGLDFAPALQGSWRATRSRFLSVLGLLALAWLPVVVFAAYSLVVTATTSMEVLGPLGAGDLAGMMEKLPQVLQRVAHLGFQQHLVLLLNLPFAWTATLTAYEDLFGGRQRQVA